MVLARAVWLEVLMKTSMRGIQHGIDHENG
jgi:hypothetical protein